jgi:hypothetical protein
MILVILALAWIAFLAPVVVRKIREMGSDRSIEHFHAEHEVLSRQGYTVEPAYRLEEPVRVAYPDTYATPRTETYATPRPEATRPRLRVVREGDTYSSLESSQSWEEWSEDYDFERGEPSHDARQRVAANRYASAYSAVPRNVVNEIAEEPIRPARSMRRRRRVVVTRLALATLVVSATAFISGISLVFDVAMLTWFADVAYVAIALFALSQGYLAQSSVGLSQPEARLAPVEPLRRDDTGRGRGRGEGYAYGYDRGYEGGYDGEDRSDASGWTHASPARYALG